MNPMLPAVAAGAYATLGYALFRLLFQILLLGPLLAWGFGVWLGWTFGAFGAVVFPVTILALSHLDVLGVSYWDIWRVLAAGNRPGEDWNWLGFAYLMLCAFACVMAMAKGILARANGTFHFDAADPRTVFPNHIYYYGFSFLLGCAFVFIAPLRNFVLMFPGHLGQVIGFLVDVGSSVITFAIGLIEGAVSPLVAHVLSLEWVREVVVFLDRLFQGAR